jgi:hypothetical protein
MTSNNQSLIYLWTPPYYVSNKNNIHFFLILFLLDNKVLLSINNLFHIKKYIMIQNDNEKIYNCQCGAAFATLKELDKHNHEAH